MSRRIRILLGIVLLIVSISFLIWGFAPARRETRTQPIAPSELQLPTPETYRFDGLIASIPHPGFIL